MLIHSLTYTLWILLGNDAEESIKLKFIKQGKLYRSMNTRDILIIVSRIIFTESSKVAKCVALKLLRREEILRDFLILFLIHSVTHFRSIFEEWNCSMKENYKLSRVVNIFPLRIDKRAISWKIFIRFWTVNCSRKMR